MYAYSVSRSRLSAHGARVLPHARHAAACVAWLDRLRWGEGFVCPECGCEDALLTSEGRRCRGCRRRISVLAGTPLHRAHAPLPQLVEAAWLLSDPQLALNAVVFERRTSMNRENARTVLHKYREVMHALMLDVHLHGIVEADEVYFGGRPRRPGVSLDAAYAAGWLMAWSWPSRLAKPSSIWLSA